MGIETLQLIIALTMFVIGTLFGSFFSLATYRIPRKQDITHTRSYCPRCKHKLGFFDCFPILSYISTVGRCKYCKCYISYRYPLMELASGFVFLFAYLFLGLSIKTFILLACYIYLFIVIGSDIMKSKMTDEEKKEIEKIVANKKSKVSKKRGALNIEIALATVIFIIYFISTMYITANYRGKLEEYRLRSTALNICTNKVEEIKATDFESLANSVVEQTIAGVEYKCEVTCSTYLKEGYIQIDTAKDIEVKVSYLFNKESKSVSIPIIREAQL